MNSPLAVPTSPSSIEARLVGETLPGDWVVTEQLKLRSSDGDSTGGTFCYGYLAERGNVKAFVKVFDILGALRRGLSRSVQAIATDFNYEAALLGECKGARLDRIIDFLDKYEGPFVSRSGEHGLLFFIVFERADSDLRKVVSRTKAVDDVLRFQLLRHAALGVQQLHGKAIAHNDLKPSNLLLVSETKGLKLCDLGRAIKHGQEQAASHTGDICAGDRQYSSPEQVYAHHAGDWVDSRLAGDLYQLGSMVCFVFGGVIPNHYYFNTLPANIKPPVWAGTYVGPYADVLPHLEAAFADFLVALRPSLPEWAADELLRYIQQMCTPNYALRGDPEARQSQGRPIGIDRFVNHFDYLGKRAAVVARAGKSLRDNDQ